MLDLQKLTVGEIMTKDVLAVDANDTLDVIAGLFEKYDFEGMPVVNSSGVVLGMITTHDLTVQSSDIHLPTLLKVMDRVTRDKGDAREIDQHFGVLHQIKATTLMNPRVVTIPSQTPVIEVAKILADHKDINPICVVDENKKLAGIVSRYDVIKFFNQSIITQSTTSVAEIGDPFKDFPTKSEHDVEEAVAKVQDEFLIVQKSRPLVWKYLAIAMFASGLIGATALIIRIAQRN
ncbi:MAG: CBS domain containing membrane protein [candidate division Kazan bacterium GW2011_GWA1_44_22]|uniref:CBS domain containing membrane protein n=1 Tax=candidate division Kazan bacterium GW2011_GWA1_44_22 TaxID=1620410 RepID=A0A0G1I018_UNCK3|nr:MAG: CBS domain containing membrane protein [candidate division Kazan bacterium GW2011_GWA1_44_22]